MHLLATASFIGATKKLHPSQKTELDAALKAISSGPTIGEAKAGHLLGVCVCKFKLSRQLSLLAYRILDEGSAKLLTFWPHENFYHDIKWQGE